MSEFALFVVLVHCCRLFAYWGDFVRCMTIEDVDLIRAQHRSHIALSLLVAIRQEMISNMMLC